MKNCKLHFLAVAYSSLAYVLFIHFYPNTSVNSVTLALIAFGYILSFVSIGLSGIVSKKHGGKYDNDDRG